MNDNQLIIKKVDFKGTELMAVQDAITNKIYVGASYICNGIGFTKGQKDRQIGKIQQDIVLKEGCSKFGAGVFDENNETIAIEINMLPLWLAKISITPKMQADFPEATQNLIEYQLKVKDVLADAFLKKQNIVPQTLQEALREYANTLDELSEQKKVNDILKPKADNFDLFMNSETSMDMGDFAKSLKITNKGKIVGRNTLFAYLQSKKLLMDKNVPYQRFLQQKLFETIEVVKNNRTYNKTLVTSKGAEYIIKILRKDDFQVEKIQKTLVIKD